MCAATFIIHYAHVPLYFNVTDDEPATFNATLSPLSISRFEYPPRVLSLRLHMYIHTYIYTESSRVSSRSKKIGRNVGIFFYPPSRHLFLPPPRKYIRLEEIEFERRGPRSAKYISIRWNFRVSKYQLSVLFAFKTYSLTVMKYRAGAWHTSLVRPVIGRIFLFWFFSLPLSPSLQRLCPLYTSYDVNYRDLITMKNSWQMTAG